MPLTVHGVHERIHRPCGIFAVIRVLALSSVARHCAGYLGLGSDRGGEGVVVIVVENGVVVMESSWRWNRDWLTG